MGKYEDLIKRLRISAQLANKGLVITPSICLEAADAIEEFSKTEKTTQEQPSHSPSLGYYYAFEFDETTGETYMPKEG